MSNGLMGNMLVEHVMEKAIKDKMQLQMKAQKQAKKEVPEEDEDEVDDEDLKEMLQEMKLARMKEMQIQLKKDEGSRGEYREITEEEFLPLVTKNALAVVHFYHQDFERCKIMDKHLLAISQLHPETKFFYLNAEKSPFFVQKLLIQVLPTVCLFQDGVMRHRLVGFQEMNGKDTFSTQLLDKILVSYGMIKVKKNKDDDSESDEDER